MATKCLEVTAMEHDVSEIPRLVRLSVAAARLGASPETLRYWIRTGRVSCTKLGRGVYLRVDELRRLIAEGSKPKGGDLARNADER
jgi:hypothetical protein